MAARIEYKKKLVEKPRLKGQKQWRAKALVQEINWGPN